MLGDKWASAALCSAYKLKSSLFVFSCYIYPLTLPVACRSCRVISGSSGKLCTVMATHYVDCLLYILLLCKASCGLLSCKASRLPFVMRYRSCHYSCLKTIATLIFRIYNLKKWDFFSVWGCMVAFWLFWLPIPRWCAEKTKKNSKNNDFFFTYLFVNDFLSNY